MTDLLYDLGSIRDKMRKRKGGRAKDPNEWRPDKAEAGKPLKWKFFILPPVDSMDLWYYEHGQHWIEKTVIECPRIHDGTECPLCQFGFDLMKDTEDKDERRKIAKNYLASSRYAVNIYWPNVASTPAELRGKVMWFSMPQSVYAIMEEVIMRDPPENDAIEPEPYGVFFDPQNAFPFVLEAKKKGDFNSYESSHFIGKQMPISKGGEEKIMAILEQRHDIPSLYDARDIDKLQSIVDSLTGEIPSGGTTSSEKNVKPKSDNVDDLDNLDELGDELDEETESSEPIEEDLEEEVVEEKSSTKKAEVEVEDDDLNSLLEDLNSDE
jgi:hypothetical protein